MNWTGKAAGEFAKNVGKVVAYARAIAHAADTTRTAPPAGAATANDPFTAPSSQSGQRQVLESLEHSVSTYTSTDKVKDPVWERDRWWWKWYDTWHYNFEVRAGDGDGSVVHGDINGGRFEDFMQQHGIETQGVSDGPLVSHPLPKDWENQVKAFEAKRYNDDGSNDDLTTAREAGNNLANDFTEQQDKFPTAPQPPQFALTNPGVGDVPGAGDIPDGGGIPTGGASPSIPGGSSGSSGSPHVPGFNPDGSGSSDHPDVPDAPGPTDSDHDGIPDSTDPYPNDSTNGGTSSGGLDSDGDGIPDVSDTYPHDPTNAGTGSGGSGGLDNDGYGVPDGSDTNPASSYPGSAYSSDPASGGTGVPADDYSSGGSPSAIGNGAWTPGSGNGSWSDGIDGASGSAGGADWPADGTDVDTGSELARAGGAGSGLQRRLRFHRPGRSGDRGCGRRCRWRRRRRIRCLVHPWGCGHCDRRGQRHGRRHAAPDDGRRDRRRHSHREHHLAERGRGHLGHWGRRSRTSGSRRKPVVVGRGLAHTRPDAEPSVSIAGGSLRPCRRPKCTSTPTGGTCG